MRCRGSELAKSQVRGASGQRMCYDVTREVGVPGEDRLRGRW